MVEILGLNRVGGKGWGGSMKIPLKFPEECPNGCRLRGRGLAVEMGEAVGQGGPFNNDNPLTWAEKCP